MKENVSMDAAVEQFDRESTKERIAKAESQRQTILSSFPRKARKGDAADAAHIFGVGVFW